MADHDRPLVHFEESNLQEYDFKPEAARHLLGGDPRLSGCYENAVINT